MKRRLHLVPFTLTVPEEKRDRTLPARLLKEGDGILAWALQGCLDWQAQGLRQPKCVADATDDNHADALALLDWAMAQGGVA